MFESFYGLSTNPFRLSPDERFIYNHKSYKKAKAYLRYALERAEGFVMVTGTPGTGKTLLVREILSTLDSTKILVLNLVSNQLQADELLRLVALEFGFHAETDDKATLLKNIQQHLSNHHAAGRRAILIIDEAQNLPIKSLEELRLLSNLQTSDQSLIQIFLIGQDELRGIILGPGMEQVSQRLVATCSIISMDVQQTREYIEYRLKSAGWKNDPLFDPAVFPVIHQFSQGIPRQVNHLTGRLLLYGALEGKHALTEDDMWVLLDELRGEHWLPKLRRGDLEILKAAHKSAPIACASANKAAHNLKQQFENFNQHVQKTEGTQYQEGLPSHAEHKVPINAPTDGLDDQAEHSVTDFTESAESDFGIQTLKESKQVNHALSIDSMDSVGVRDTAAEEGNTHPEAKASPLVTDEDLGNTPTTSNRVSDALSAAEIAVVQGIQSQIPPDSHTETFDSHVTPIETHTEPLRGHERNRYLLRLAYALSAILIGFAVFFPKSSDLPMLWQEIFQEDRSLFLGDNKTQQAGQNSRGNESPVGDAPDSEEIAFIVSDQMSSDKPEAPAQPSDVISGKASLTDGKDTFNTTEDTQAITADQSSLPIKPDSSPIPGAIDQEKQDFQLAQAEKSVSPSIELIPMQQAIPEQDIQHITSVAEDAPSMVTEPEVAPLSESTTQEPQVSQQDEIALSQGHLSESLTSPQTIIERDDPSITSSLTDFPALTNKQPVIQGVSSDSSSLGDRDEEYELELTTVKTIDPAIAAETELDQIYRVYFNFDSSRIDQTYIPLLDDIVNKLNRYPPTYIQITGFTDASGDPVYNRILSDRRARAIANYLKKQGIDQKRIKNDGLGALGEESGNEIEPLKDRKKKRRVDLQIRLGV